MLNCSLHYDGLLFSQFYGTSCNGEVDILLSFFSVISLDSCIKLN